MFFCHRFFIEKMANFEVLGLPKPFQNRPQNDSKSAALLAAPGVLDPTTFLSCINLLHFLTGGWAVTFQGGFWEGREVMLAHFSLLGVFFSLLACSCILLGTFWPFLGVLERFGLDFGGFWGGSGMVLELPGLVFQSFFVNASLHCKKAPDA